MCCRRLRGIRICGKRKCEMFSSVKANIVHSFHCLFCLGYEERGAECSGVLAVQALAMMPPLAIHMADNAAQLSKEVTIFTNGSEEVAEHVKAVGANSPFLVDSRPTRRLTESNGGVKVEFSDGGSKQVAFRAHNPDDSSRSIRKSVGAEAVVDGRYSGGCSTVSDELSRSVRSRRLHFPVQGDPTCDCQR